MRSNSSSADGPPRDMHEQQDPEEDFELNDLTSNHNGSRFLGTTFDSEFEDLQSDEEEKSPNFLISRRASASTLQSFMLYTPDEERSIIRKFDYRLVMFVALLYMLSFLDRSSTFISPIDRSVLTSSQILEMRGLPVCQRIYI